MKRRWRALAAAAAEAAVGVEDRQQREPDAGVRGGRGDARGELAADRRTADAAAVVVQVVKLADAREARLQHLRERERTDRLELIGLDALDERYMSSRQLQKLSACAPRRSVSPASAR